MSKRNRSQAGRTFQPRLEAFENRLVPAGFTPIPEHSVCVSADDGGSPHVQVINPVSGATTDDVQAYEESFRGGVRTALGDVNGDGVKDMIIAPGVGGGPRIKILDGKTGTQIADFFVYEPSFTGGLYV